jgi:competence protein ComEC
VIKISEFRFRRTTLILVGCVAVLVGIAIAKLGVSADSSWVILFTLFLSLTAKNKNIVTLLVVVALGLLMGTFRGSQFIVETRQYDELFGRSVVLVGEAKSDAIYDGPQLSFDMGDLALADPREDYLVGKVSVKGFGETAVYRGDIVQVEGKIYPTLGSKQARISFAQIDVVSRNSSAVEKLRRDFAAGMYSALPEPQASFGLGLLVGQRNTLPEAVSESLKTVGLTHIVAVSGYNLTILVRAAQRAFGRRSKYQATVAASALMLVFLAVTGLSASIVRASIVSGLALIAWYFGRNFRPTVLIAFTAALTGLWYPVYVWSDIGWYLSFLAFFGVLVLAPLIANRISSSGRELKGMRQIVLESFCAQIMVTPLILYIFHEASLVSLVTNALVVPLVPLAMLLAAVAGAAGILFVDLAGWVAWPAKYLLTYMLDIAELFSRVPNAKVSLSVGVVGVILLYGILCLVTLVLGKRTARHRDILG